jgi:hypothetical protein
MARNYSFSGPNATGGTGTSITTGKTLVSAVNTTAVRARIFDITIGSTAVPADQAATYVAARFAAGKGTTAAAAPTPAPLDNAEPVAAVAVGEWTHSAEPSYTAGLLYVPLNQRATFRYVASPGAEFMGTNTTTAGVGVLIMNATASMIEWATILWFE